MRTTNYSDRKVVEKYFKKPLSASFINYPAILKLLGEIRGKIVLDLGCGAGVLAKKICMKGASVYAIDSSQRWIDICKKQNKSLKNIKFIAADADNLRTFKNSKFDIVVANMVFLCISSRQKLETIFSEVSRVLKKGGFLIFSDCHPITNMIGQTSTKVSGAVQGFSYFDEGEKFKSTYLLSDYSRIEFTDAHWSLEFYSRVLNKNGMVIEKIVEPKPVKMDPRKRFKGYKIPEYIVFKCKKLH
ncbi:MAG: class I SAM-dependent methyltransferase [Candidatus Omnitrophica bacterium]|nr:class I SAM-dependent methyltransferase [Candidatus Omnitrophota bacterium]